VHKVMLNCKRLCILYMIDKQENTGHESKGNCIYYLTDNDEGMKKLIAWFVNEVMQEEAEQQAGAERYQRTSSRKTYRNGHRKRTLKTRYGEVILNKPQLRDTPFQIKVFEQYSRTGKAVENTILESYLQGVSTRKIQVIVAHSGVGKISASYISKIATELDHNVHHFILVSGRSPPHISRRLPLNRTIKSTSSYPGQLKPIFHIPSQMPRISRFEMG